MKTDTHPPRLHKDTRLGAIHLNALDPEALSSFYQEALGLKPMGRDGEALVLGNGIEALLCLHPAGGPRPSRSAGLYHFCLAVERREALGWWLARLLEQGRELGGLVDHRMAEAVYLEDPEGNGVELNWDRPRSEWRPWGEWLAMGNAPLDTRSLLALARSKPIQGLPKDARIGHLHLHVGSLEDSGRFYSGLLGLERTAEVPGQAVFTSAGGYHHHIAFNVWKGRGVAAVQEGAPGLRYATLKLGSPRDLAPLRRRLQEAGWAFSEDAEGLRVKDPSGNGLLVTV